MQKHNRGDLLLVRLNSAIGSEQRGERPVVIIQNDVGNKYSPTLIISAITAQTGKTVIPTHVEIEDYKGCGLEKKSIILLEQLYTIDKRRIIKKLGSLNEKTMKKLEKALSISIGQ